MSLTVTDLFAGFGGASSGAIMVPDVHIQIAANHWSLAVEVHNLNHPTTDHAQVDLHLEDPRFFPKTDILWASPECTAWSQAGGGKHGPLSGTLAEPDLFSVLDEDDLLTTVEDEATRSRLLMFDVLRFIDHHRYAAVIVENVVDIATQAKYARAWQAWQRGLRNLGYSYRVVSLNSMHAQTLGMPAPQSRDRLYIIAWPTGHRAPDVERFIRPKAWCARCATVGDSRQAWKPGRTVGRYRAQYVYVCASCSAVVEPGWLPAAAAIDWTMPGTRIGDRVKPLAPKTIARIKAGMARYWAPFHLEAGGNQYDAADPRHPRHGQPDAYYRAWPVRDLDPHSEHLPTIVADGANHALLTPYYGASETAKPTDQPVGTFTTRDKYGLIMRNNTSRSGDGAEMSSPIGEVLRTLTTKGHQSLITADDITDAQVDECYFRMLEPSEIGQGMAFSPDYQVLGTRRDQVRGYGNAVTPPAARDLVACVVEALGGAA